MEESNTASRVDPLAALSRVDTSKTSSSANTSNTSHASHASHASNSRPAQRDNTPEIHAAFALPSARPDTTLERAAIGPITENRVESLDTNSAQQVEVQSVMLPSPHGTKDQKSEAFATVQAVAPIGGASASPKPVANDQELLCAFLKGAGVPDLDLPNGLTPQLAEEVGRLLREATQGTLDLLVARALGKRELRAHMTIIVAQENNPLKFSPNVETALAHLLAPTGAGLHGPCAGDA